MTCPVCFQVGTCEVSWCVTAFRVVPEGGGGVINIYLDDVREPPNDGDNWIIVRTAEACIELLERSSGIVQRISLDHDLGTDATGYDVALWIEERAASGRSVAKYLHCHSANPVGRARIERAFESARRHLEAVVG